MGFANRAHYWGAVAAVLLACRAGRAAEAVGGSGDAEVVAALRPIVEKSGVPAMAAAVVTSRGMGPCGAVGVRKSGAPVAAGTNDLWHLGSDTKAMTAVLVGQLVEQGDVTWDTTVAEIFPERAAAFHAECRAITLRQLLTHRSGVRANLDWGALAKEGGSVQAQRLKALEQGLSEKPAFAPGSSNLYSNAGYVILGAVIERKTGRAWEEVIQERLFKPLGMQRAGFGGTGTPGQLDQPWGHAKRGRPVANGPESDNPPVMGPAGRVHCPLSDWALFVADQLRGAEGRDGLLKAATYRAMQTPAGGGEQAMGWMSVERPWGGGRVLTHSGCNTMNFAVAWLAPRRDFAVLVCANQGDDAAAQACDQAAAALIGLAQQLAADADPQKMRDH